MTRNSPWLLLCLLAACADQPASPVLAPTPVRTAEVAEDDPSVILFTSGTSGKPKGALHSQRNLLAVADYHRYSDALLDAFAGREYDPNRPSDLATADWTS